MNLILYFLACAGATSIISQSKLFKPIRERLEPLPLHCPQCVGAWIGGLFYFLMLKDYGAAVELSKLPIGSTIQFVFAWAPYAFASSLVSYWLAMLVGDAGFRIDRNTRYD